MEGYKKPIISNKELITAQKKAILDMKADGVNPEDFEGQIMDESFNIGEVLSVSDAENSPEESE